MSVELKYNQLRKHCGKKSIPFETTDDIDGYDGVIGQHEAAEALMFGLRIHEKGYNIYVSGLPGSGKTTFAAAFSEKLAKKLPSPDDLCYIYNFKEPRRPKKLLLPAGMGAAFRADMETFQAAIGEEIPRVFSGRDFENRKHAIVKIYQDKRDAIIKDISDEAKSMEYGVKMTGGGIYFMPIVDGEMISEEQYNALSQEERDSISERTEIIQTKAQEVMHDLREYERTTQQEVSDLERSVGQGILDLRLAPVMEKYKSFPDAAAYLKLVGEDVLDNLGDFAIPEGDDEDYLQSIMPWIGKKEKNETVSKYKVNLLTDNSGHKGAPVVVDFNPTYSHIIGEVEYDSEFGNLTTDFMKIKPGLLHKANHGFLILQARDVLSNPGVWDALCKCLITGNVTIEPLREYSTGIAMAGIKPEPVEIDLKIILIGSGFYYELLREYDEEFGKLFKIIAMFDYEMPFTGDNVKKVSGFIKKFTQGQGGAPFDNEAVALVIEYMSRLAERQDKLTTQFGRLREILVESSARAELDGKGIVSAKHVKRAITDKDRRVGIYEDKLTEMIEQGIIMIDTDGEKVAQVNGLAVLETGDHIFAKPTRITATTYVGKAGIVNIEKEADMSGNIHDKGVQVISGYLGQKYAQNFPLSLSCRICFEQNYSGVDGDSASSAELYAILSSLADVPLRQDVAVTGSINQRGEIQAIGGVTYKIEGFFSLCKQRGLTGRQGVVIPAKNVRDLALNDDVVEAVKEGLFHIYPIDHVDEGISILTGLAAGVKENGKYLPDSVHGMVYRKLRRFYKKSSGE